MRWKIVPKKPANPDLHAWHRVFAWWPVEVFYFTSPNDPIQKKCLVWLETVERRLDPFWLTHAGRHRSVHFPEDYQYRPIGRGLWLWNVEEK